MSIDYSSLRPGMIANDNRLVLEVTADIKGNGEFYAALTLEKTTGTMRSLYHNKYGSSLESSSPSCLNTFREPSPGELKGFNIDVIRKDASFLLGADPEIFVVDENGIIIPGFNYLPEKDNPVRWQEHEWGKKGEILYNDGFQAEFAVEPQNCVGWMVDSFYRQLCRIQREARKKYPNAKLVADSTLDIPEQLLMMAEDHHVRLGCAPSFNAYGDHGEPVVDGRFLPWRFAGCHMHFGVNREYNFGLPKSCKHHHATPEADRVVRALDGTVGLAATALFGHLENKTRRRFYGQAGEYRLPAHGLEYRTISSLMLRHPIFCHICLDLARWGVRIGMCGLYAHYNKNSELDIRHAINESNVKFARELLKANESFMLPFFQKRYADCAQGGNVWDVLMGKQKISGTSRLSVEEAWKLGTFQQSAHEVIGLASNATTDRWISHSEGRNCRVASMVLG